MEDQINDTNIFLKEKINNKLNIWKATSIINISKIWSGDENNILNLELNIFVTKCNYT